VVGEVPTINFILIKKKKSLHIGEKNYITDTIPN
jgi:hypothetical protein